MAALISVAPARQRSRAEVAAARRDDHALSDFRIGIGVATGTFGAMMDVELLNVGPVTIVIEVQDGRVV